MDYDQRYDEALFRADEEREAGRDTERGDCPGIEFDSEEGPDEVPEDDPVELDPEAEIEPEAEPEAGGEPLEPLDVDIEEEDPSEDEEDDAIPRADGPADPAPIEVPAGDEVVWTDIPMYPQAAIPPSPPVSPIVEVWGHPPVTPPGSPMTVEDSDEMPDSEPDLPAPPPVPVMTVYEHDIILAHSTAELVVAHARVDELRLQLDAEREARFRDHRRRQRRDFAVRRALRSVRRIERRALTRMHSLTPHHSRRLYREDAARVVTRAMARVRRVIRDD